MKNTTRIKANTFGFYALNGRSTVRFYDGSKKEQVCHFLETIREQNPDKRIILILDNFRSHHAIDTLEYAAMLNICLVFLPPYSPDLNPIEFIWKDDKREISTSYITSKEQMRVLIAETFTALSRRLSYARAWINQFLTPLHISITN